MNKVLLTLTFTVAVAVPVLFFIGYVNPTLHQLQVQNQELMGKLNKHDAAHKRSLRTANEDTLPKKFAAPHLTPRYYQEDRGTCWDFATIGVLEQSYRANGIKKGYMKENEYLRLNEQAYGLSVIEACKDHPDVCDVIGDFVYQNSTSGGEVYWLWNLKELYDKLLPDSVCPYTDPEHEHECPRMAAALATNPIKFDVKDMETAYTAAETKALLVAKNSPLAWSSAMHVQFYHFPCSDAYWKGRPECAAGKAVRCPTDKYYNSELCARVESSMFNPDGEFYLHGVALNEGGHAMNVVGYNDEFPTRDGSVGGFIIRNSWHDATYGSSPAGRGARGSHSIKYWMQEISAWDEKAICPLPLNPENWMNCAEQQVGPHTHANKAAATNTNGDVLYDNLEETCLSETFMKHLIDVSLQPNEFVCKDEAICSKDARYRYFFMSIDHTPAQDLARLQMLQYDTVTKAQKLIVTPYHIPAMLSYFFEPVQAQLDQLKNSEDECGYWFWPYDMLHKQQGLFQNFFSSYFDIEWADQSYLAKAGSYPKYDYSWIKASTKTQEIKEFATPNPFANTRYN